MYLKNRKTFKANVSIPALSLNSCYLIIGVRNNTKDLSFSIPVAPHPVTNSGASPSDKAT